MGLAGTRERARRRVVVGLFVALAITIGFLGALVAGGSIAATGSVVAPSAIPTSDPAVAAAAWDEAHPPPPPPLPVPAALPNPSAHRDLAEIGRIQIPKTGLDQPVREGVEQMVIDAGPAHWPGTAAFGGWGNVVLAGHRTSHTEPFLRNAELAPGDDIVLSDPTGSYHYGVTSVEVVPNTAMWIVDQHPGRTLTIFTCHPIGSSAERLVVRAILA